MTSIVKFTALSGARDESPPCYLLEVDEMTLLLDCGWDEKFNMDFIEEVKKHINVIDAVLISFPDVFHLGALPYLVGKCGLNCPIYATIPVYKMGQMFMYDLYQSHHNMKNFNVFSLDDVDATFEKIIQLKFNQSVSIKGKGFGVTITPLPAGHMIGGTIWKILKVGEEDVIYANDFNHKKERHLNGCELEKLQRPSLLITDGFNAGYQQARRRTRDEKLMTNILQTLRNNGNVLISVDTAGRVLELAHMLDQLWRNKESGLLSYSLALLNNVSYNVVEFAKSQIEWMSDKLMRNFEGARNNPFQFKHLQLCHSLHELSKVSSPKVVLASSPDMESGFSRELFLQWCSNPNNSVIITSRTSPGTLARDLVDNGGNRTIDLTVEKRVRLEGAELEEYQKKMKDFRQDNGDSDSDDDIEMSVISKGRHDIVIKEEGKVSGGFFKVTKKQYPMYPFKEDKIKYDEYGEIIRPEDYKLSDVVTDSEDNKENVVVKKEEEEIELRIRKRKKVRRKYRRRRVHYCFKIIPGVGLVKVARARLIPEVPTKCIVLQRTVQVNCQVQYIDFEGRSDGESLVKILSQLKPRRIILVRSPEENSKIIEKHCQDSVSGKIFTPEKGEAIDATSETHIYQVRLMDRLSHSLKFIKTKDGDIAWIDGQLIAREGTMDKQRMIVDDCFSDDDDDFDEFTLAPCSTEKTHDPVFINELKLSDFKMILAKNNINSEFSGGVLWCSNATIAIRRVENSKILLEGCVSEDYYRVRSLLYEQYAML